DTALQRLAQFSFPGNVRQLENICHWLTVMAPAQQISVQDLPPEVLHRSAAAPDASITVTEHQGEPRHLAASMEMGKTVVQPTSAAMWSSPDSSSAADDHHWESLLEAEARKLLAQGNHDVWDILSKRFESSLITTALAQTHGKRMEAAQRLG